MNENINLCEILKGHERETFYHTFFGPVKLVEVLEEGFIIDDYDYIIPPNGIATSGELCFFPSKDQRDWIKWDKENNHKTPKTWDEYKQYFNINTDDLCIDLSGKNNNGWTRRNTSIEKSALALLKIHQLIEVGYEGNVTNKEWENDDWKYVIGYYPDDEEFPIKSCTHDKSLIAFHTREQAKNFISYSENVQLLKDYFMI